jgi:alpha-1,2-mannosyltransferase
VALTSSARPVRSGRAPRLALAATLFLISLAALLAVFQVFARHPWSMLDLRIYLWGGGLVRHGDDPYQYHYVHGLQFTYTPFAAWLFSAIAYAKAQIVKVALTAASIAALVAVLWLTWGALGYPRSQGRLSATLCSAAVALLLEPVWQTLSYGQINLILMLVIVADMCLPDDRRWKGIGIGLAAGFKLTPLIFIPYLLLTKRFRAAAVASVTFLVTVGVSLLVLYAAGEDYWLDGLFLNSKRIGNLHYVGNQSLNGALLRLLGNVAAAGTYRLLVMGLAAIAGLLLATWASRRGHDMGGLIICALTGLLVSPVSWSHHWVWVAPGLVVLTDLAINPRWRPASRRWQWALYAGSVTIVVIFAGPLWAVPSPAVQGFVMTAPQQVIGDLYVLSGLIALAVVAVVMFRTRKDQRLLPLAYAASPAFGGLKGEISYTDPAFDLDQDIQEMFYGTDEPRRQSEPGDAAP